MRGSGGRVATCGASRATEGRTGRQEAVARLRHASHVAALSKGEEEDRGASGLGCCWAGHLGPQVAAQVSCPR